MVFQRRLEAYATGTILVKHSRHDSFVGGGVSLDASPSFDFRGFELDRDFGAGAEVIAELDCSLQ